MANDTRKLVPVELSQLPAIENPSGFWIFGSKTEEDGTFSSGRYLFDKLAEYARDLQLERRISLTMETEEMEMFIGEEMTIYKIVSQNVKTLKINGTVIENVDNNTLDLKVDKASILKLAITTKLSSPKAFLFIYAKATMP